jgi:cytoskeletal protein CcmA (bactofilin family)
MISALQDIKGVPVRKDAMLKPVTPVIDDLANGHTAPTTEDQDQPARLDFDVIGKSTRVEGRVTAQNLRIIGTVTGDIQASIVQIGESAVVTSDVSADDAMIAGTYSGTMTCSQRLLVRAQANVSGTIVTPALLIQDGAVFDVHVRNRPETASEPSPTEAAS